MKEEYDFSAAQPARARKLPPQEKLDRFTKERITIMLDLDILEYFRSQARQPGSDGYQTLINKALRIYMEAIHQGAPMQQIKTLLLNDPSFIQALARSMETQAGSGARRRRTPGVS